MLPCVVSQRVKYDLSAEQQQHSQNTIKNTEGYGSGFQSWAWLPGKDLGMHAEEFQFTWSVCSWPNEHADIREEAIPVGQVVREGFLEEVGLEPHLEGWTQR